MIESGGAWKREGEDDVLELKGGQSLTGRLWDVLWMLHAASTRAEQTDRVHFQVLVDMNGDGHHETVWLWALCGAGHDGAPVITIMLEGED